MDQRIPNKLFFKIGEVCELTDTQPYVLRYWESEFPVLAPAKNNSGQRIYRRRDIDTILRIKALLYTEGFTIAGAKKKIEQEMKEQEKGGEANVADGPSAGDPYQEQIQNVRTELEHILKLMEANDKALHPPTPEASAGKPVTPVASAGKPATPNAPAVERRPPVPEVPAGTGSDSN